MTYVDAKVISVRSLNETRKYLFNAFLPKPYLEVEKTENIVSNETHREKEYSTGITEVITKGGPQ